MRHPFFVPLAMVLSVAAACSSGYRVEKDVDDLRVTLSSPAYPLARGENPLTVEIAERGGGAAAGATVAVSYRLPPMPGMAPLEYRADATPRSGGAWTFAAATHTAAPWNVAITVSRPGKPPARAEFTIEAR